jgi:hypothetical protein
MAVTPEEEARWAVDYGVPRSTLTIAGQHAFDQLIAADPEAKAKAAKIPDGSLQPPISPARSSPEVRARILQMIKQLNPKYARPFEQDRLALASFIGTESWAEYGQVVLQMAILDTLLSIEEQLTGLAPQKNEHHVDS